MILALKSAVAHFSGRGLLTTAWPPLVALTDETAVAGKLAPLGFAMPGLRI
jgi:hypothetical protein